MQATAPFGSSLNLAVSSKCSIPRTTTTIRCGEGGRGSLHQLKCSTSRKPFLVGDSSGNPFRFPSRSDIDAGIPLRPQHDHQTKAFTKFFVNSRKWGQKEPPSSQPQSGANGAVLNQSWVSRKGKGFWQKSAWVAAAVLLGGGALYGQNKAQAYLESTFLPPLAAMVGEQFGREVELGKIQRLTPLGLTIGPCSVGAHDEEFSCGEIPGVEIRVLPIASLRRGQLVVDAILAQPHLLVSQKEDWTWLGIPMLSDEKKFVRHSSEPNLDSRTKVRRLSREEGMKKLSNDRRQAAKDSAKKGYKLAGAGVQSSDKVVSASRQAEKVVKSNQVELYDSENEEEIDTSPHYLGINEVDGIKAGKLVEERLTEGDEASNGFELRNSVLGAKVWIDTNMLKPVKRRVLRRWTRQSLHLVSKVSMQRRNLDRSAAAARSYFQNLEKNLSSGNKGEGGGSSPLNVDDQAPLPGKESLKEFSKGRTDVGNLRQKPVGLKKDSAEAFGPAHGQGFLFDPISKVNRSVLPRMSLSSSWGARDGRKEEGECRPDMPKLVVQVEDVVNYNKRAQQVDFRKMNRRMGMGLGSRDASGASGGPYNFDHNKALSNVIQVDGLKGVRVETPTVHQSPKKKGSSLVTIESVKEALVQAIREKQELFRSKGKKFSRYQDQFKEADSSLERSLAGSGISDGLHLQSQLGSENEIDQSKEEDGSLEPSLSGSGVSDGSYLQSQLGSHNETMKSSNEGLRTLSTQTSLPCSSIESNCDPQFVELSQTNVVKKPEDEKVGRRHPGAEVALRASTTSEGIRHPDSTDADLLASMVSKGRSQTYENDSVIGFKDQMHEMSMEEGDGLDQMHEMSMEDVKPKNTTVNRPPVALNSVYFKDGTLMLLAFGDNEPRVMEKATGQVKFGSSYDQINVHVTGSPREFRTENSHGDGGKLFVKVAIDLAKQEWHLKVRGRHLFAPLFEKLLEIPLDWSDGRASGEVHAWMLKDDLFPSFGGRVDVKGLDFAIWDAPAAFKGVSGTLFFQGQRLFFHNASGLYGAIPLEVSGDMDLNPDDGEYRLSCQVFGVEANALMKTLKAQPPPFPLAGALKAVVHCRGPLDAPIFEGSAELTGKQMSLVYDAADTAATRAIKETEHDAAIGAYDRVTFASASSSFTFNTDDCMAELYGIKAVPVGGGEIRGAGNLWICPEGELDPSAVNVDCSGQVATDHLLHSYIPAGVDVSSTSFGIMHGNAKIRGALLMPEFDIKWNTPEARGSFDGAHGDVRITREAIKLTSSAFTYDLSTKIHTCYPPIDTTKRTFDYTPAPLPIIEGLDLDLRLRGFDVMGLAPPSFLVEDSSHMKLTGKVKFNGHLPNPTKSPANEEEMEEGKVKTPVALAGSGISGLIGRVSLSGVKLNQLLVARKLTGSLEITPSYFKVHATGRSDEHLHLLVSKRLDPTSESRTQDSYFEQAGQGTSFSLLKGQLRTDFDYHPRHSAKLEIRNLQLDELELASLRGAVQKADLTLNFQKRRGQGSLSVREPRGSGIQGQSLDIAARWSGDVITLDKSVLVQANSQYEVQGEYVLPGLRDRSAIEKGNEGMWEKVMAGQLGHMITSMGRWRLRLDVPNAEVADMLPVARLLSRSSDPAVVSRSKELFLQGVQSAGFPAEAISLEYIRRRKDMVAPEGSPESIPLPGLAELRGGWHGTLEASGGGDGDTYADFDLRGDEWEWGSYKTKKVMAIGDYSNNDGLRLQKFFIQKDTATLHADGTLLGPKPNLHFAVLNFPVDLVPPLLHAIQSSTPERFLSPASRSYSTPIKGILYMEGDLRGNLSKPQCDVQIRLLDGSVGGVSLGKAEMAASLTSANRLAFNAVLEPVAHSGHVRVQGSLPMGSGSQEELEVEVQETERDQHKRTGGWGRERSRERLDDEDEKKDESIETGGEEGWEVRLAESLKELDGDFLESGAVKVDAAVKDGGMMLLTAISPSFQWIQGNADIKLKVRGTVQQPTADGTASFYKVAMSSPVLPRPVTNLGGTIKVKNNQLVVEGLEGRVGRRGLVEVRGQLPLRINDPSTTGDAIEVKAEYLEVRARHVFSGQLNSHMRVMGSLLEPEVTGMIKLSHGEAYLSQEKGASSSSSAISSSPVGGGYSWMSTTSSAARHADKIFPLPKNKVGKSSGSKDEQKDERNLGQLPPIDVRLKSLKLLLGPELRMVYPLILNFAVSGELELTGFADSLRVKPRGTLTFENGDVNLVATQVRLNKDHPNRAKFEPEQGLDPTLDLALIGADWQLRVHGRARNWQDNIVVSSTRTGEQDDLTRTEAEKAFESQLAESLLEGDGQLAFKKLAAATVETLMPRIETKGEFGQARWRLVSAPQIPNLLSLDPTTDPFKSLANLSFGAEVEVQLGQHLQASVARRLKESEMATEWTLLYQLNSKLRLLFSSIPNVDNRLLFEYSATSQN